MSNENLQIRKPIDYSNDILDKLSFLSISKKYKIIGTASIKNILYSSDYDMNEYVMNPKHTQSTSLEYIYNLFLKKFEYAEKRENRTYIMDFKCGIQENGEPLRWNYEDMKRGYKIINKVTYDFLHSLMEAPPNLVKLDVISFLNGRFMDMSEIYNIKIGKLRNYKLLSKESILLNIKKESEELKAQGNYYKALKRIFSMRRLQEKNHINKKTREIVALFNSDIGIIGKSKSDLDILIDVMKKYPKRVYPADIKSNIQLIKYFLSYVTTIPMERIIEQLDRSKTIPQMEKIRDELFHITNSSALKLIHREKL